MAITVSDAASLVIDQLNIQSDAETPPTTAMVEGFIRRGAQRVVDALQPVFLTSVSLSSMAGTVSGKAQILHVEVGTNALNFNEWRETTTGLKIIDYSLASASDTAYVWYTKQFSIADDAATIDLDCIHGANWGKEAILSLAEIRAELRLSNTDASNAMVHMQRYRTLERQFEQQMAELRARRAEDLNILASRLQYRMQFGRGTWRESAVAEFRNDSNISDRTTGET